MINHISNEFSDDVDNEVVIGISETKLLELMRLGVICGADIQAKNRQSKGFVQQACLNACAEKVCRDCSMHSVCAAQFDEGKSFQKTMSLCGRALHSQCGK